MRTVRGLAGLAFVAAFAAACSAGAARRRPRPPPPPRPRAPSVDAPLGGLRRAVPVGRRLRAGEPGAQDRRQADDRRGQPRLPAVLRAVRHEPRSVGARRPDQRQGLRERRRLRDRRGDGLREGRGHLGLHGAVQQRDPRRVPRTSTSTSRRSRTAPSAPRRSTSPTATTTSPSPSWPPRQQVRQGDDDRRPQGLPARRPGRDDQPRDDHRRHRADQGAEGLRLQRRCRSRPSRTARSTAWSSTSRPRST